MRRPEKAIIGLGAPKVKVQTRDVLAFRGLKTKKRTIFEFRGLKTPKNGAFELFRLGQEGLEACGGLKACFGAPKVQTREK